jgi:hypothetical protein
MKVTYTVPKATYDEVMTYVEDAADFFMANDCNEFRWDCVPTDDGYIVKVIIDAKEDINPY